MIESKLIQLMKTHDPIFVTDLGIVIETKSIHVANALSPIVVTELGMAIFVSPKQAVNADAPMDVTVLGIMVLLQPATRVLLAVLIMALQLSRESKTGLSLSTMIDERLLHSEKACSSMLFTEAGIVIDDNEEQP